MSIEQALSELVKSEQFKLASRKNSSLRTYLARYNQGSLKNGAAIEMLVQFGYTITVKGPVKKK